MDHVDDLRQQLRERGYLSRGIERWFALDPWTSRTFWQELWVICFKAALLLAPFGALPMLVVMLLRNTPLALADLLSLLVVQLAAWFVLIALFLGVVALVLRLRPEMAIDTPRALLAVAIGVSTLLAAIIAVWWYGFDLAPSRLELLLAGLMTAIFFVIATIVVSAALLSFSIFEMQRIPAVHQRPRTIPIAIAALVLLAGVLLPPALESRREEAPPPQVVTRPATARVAWIAVDGLTHEVFSSHPGLSTSLPESAALLSPPGASTTERWATVGTGTPAARHGVHAVEGIRLPLGTRTLQQISRTDPVLRRVGRPMPLPPTARQRDYVWEILAERSIPIVATNWWTTSDHDSPPAVVHGQEKIFATASQGPLAIDTAATKRFLDAVDRHTPRFATVYLPSLDIVLNRVALDSSTRVALSVRALDALRGTIEALRWRGYQVVVIGLPGDEQRGRAVVASTVPLRVRSTADLAPTLLDQMGFPASTEMAGATVMRGSKQERIRSFGSRSTKEAPRVDEEYYENLKSLGYIR